MVDIDERVVSMKFDSSDFEQKSKSTLSILDKLRDKLSFKDAMDNDSMNAITDNVEKIANKAYTIVDRMVDKIKDNIANKLVNFLQENTVGQIAAGWNKYADMTTSVATLKSQGYAMEQITDQLERLNYFTDETSFNFTAMVGEIGKFTASGQSLEDATTAMMGIAEWAALSGKNAGEASRAMYQLSQALGAGQMRLQDYKSVQNLNMDTIEFRKNAIEAALAVGTLKDNLDGTYTSLLNNKITFSLQNFTESLTQGKWFNTNVMMTVYKKYSEAVDEIRAIYEEGSYTDAQGNFTSLNTTADAVREVKKNNEYLLKKFSKTELKSEDITTILNKWKKVEKVTDETVAEYAEINKLTEEQARIQMQQNYADYLKEYAEVFQETEQSAVAALEDWHTYVSEYGIKAFAAAQEAKTFTEAIESAKDAASTVWTTIYTTVFGDYEEAKELWTDLANALYEIFVNRLWDLSEIFDYWKSGGRSAMEAEMTAYEKELEAIKKKGFIGSDDQKRMAYLAKEIARLDTQINTIIVDGERTTTYALQEIIDNYAKEAEELTNKDGLSAAEQARLEEVRKEIDRLNEQMENTVFVNGRRQMFQGIYAFGSGFKNALMSFRDAWDSLIEDNSGGEYLLSLSEKIRTSGFKFYLFIDKLGKTDFFKNIAQSIQNLLAPIRAVKEIIRSVIGQFLPNAKDAKSMLVTISEAIKNLTARLVPSQKTIYNIARILRGVISIFRLLAKAIIGVWNSIIKPIFDQVTDIASNVFDRLLEAIADIADAFFGWEKGVDEMTAMATVGKVLQKTLGGILKVIGTVVKTLLVLLKPAIDFVSNSIGYLIGKVKELLTGNGGNLLENISNGIQNIAGRARAAWNSVESFSSVFNTFKDGTGIGNFLEMIGALIDNIITRIGRTILAILGLEDTIQNNSGIGKALNSIREAVHAIATVFAWLYTNVIRPVLQTLFIGIGAGLKDIGNAFKSGDILHVLEVIKETIKTIGALEIFKVIKAISGILGSGGLLKVFRNAAKALRSISSYFNAKALNERSSAIMKLAISVGLLVGLIAALTFLPAKNLENMGKSLLYVGGALVLMIASLVVLSVVAQKSRWGLLGMSAALFGLIGLVVVFLYAAQKVRDLMTELFVVGTKMVDGEEVEITGGEKFLAIASGLTPIILAVTLVLTILLVLRKLGATTALMNFALTMAGIAIGVGAMVIALKMLDDYVREMDTSHIIGSLLILVVLLAAVSGAIILATRFMGTGFRFSGGKQALAFALGVAALVASVAFILVPCLEDLVKQSDKFGEYMVAVYELALMMFTLSGSFALMTRNIKNGFYIIMAAGAFAIMAKVIQSILLPSIVVISTLSTSVIPGVTAIGLFIIAIGYGMRLVMDGIANIITAVSKIKAKQFIAIILSLTAMIAAIMGLSYIFNKNGASIDVGFILAAVGIVAIILLAVGLFAKILAKEVIYDAEYAKRFYKVFSGITAFISAIMLGLMGIVVVVNLTYKDNWETALFILGVFAGVTLATLAGVLFIFTKAIDKLSLIIAGLTSDDIIRLTKLLKMFFISMAVFFGVLIGNTIVVNLTYGNDSLKYFQMMAAFVLSASVFLLIVFSTIGKFIKSIIYYGITNNELAMVSITMLSIMVMFGELGFIVIPAMKNLMGLNWETILAAMVGISAVIISILGMTAVIANASKGGFSELSIITGLLGLIATLVVIAGLMPAIFKAFQSIKDFTSDDIRNGLIALLVPLGALVLLITVFAASDTGLLFLKTAGEISLGLLAIAAAIGAVAAAVQFFKEVFGIGMTTLNKVGEEMDEDLSKSIEGNNRKTLKAISNNSDEQDKTYKKKKKIRSPSKVYAEYGKMIDLGLAQGINKNREMAIDAATGLAIYTDESFCETLGIASPSKVFYENGRFVVRGFINGMGDETNKNKQAGADMASGFTEGMEDAMENMKSNFAGLWSEFGEDFDIKKWGEEFGDQAAGGIFDGLFGSAEQEIEVKGRKLTEEEKKLKKELEKELKELNKTTPTDSQSAANRTRRIREINEEINRLNLITVDHKEIQKTENQLEVSFSNLFGTSLGNAIDGLSNDSEIAGKVTGLGSMIAGGLGDAFGIDKEWFTNFKNNPSQAIGELGNYLTGTGGPLDGLTSKFTTYFGSNTFLDTVTDAGEKAADAFVNGMSKTVKAWNPLGDLPDWLQNLILYGNINGPEKGKTPNEITYDDKAEDLKIGVFSGQVSAITIPGKFADLAESSGIRNLIENSDQSSKILKILEKREDYDSVLKPLLSANGHVNVTLTETETKQLLKDLGIDPQYLVSPEEIETLDNSLQNLLTEYDFDQETFNREQIVQIKDKLDEWGLTTESGALKITGDMSSYEVSSILQLLNEIATNGLKINDNAQAIYNKSLYDEIRDSNLTLDKITKLEEAAKKDTKASEELGRLLNGKSVKTFLDEVNKDYNNLVGFMRSTEYNSMNDTQKKYYKDKKAYYETYFGLTEPEQQKILTNYIGKYQKQEMRDILTKNDKHLIGDIDFNKVQDFIDKTGLEFSGEEIMKLFQLGLDKGWFYIDQDGKFQAQQLTGIMINTIKKELGIKSPSQVAIGIMDYFMQGFNIGIDENISSVLGNITNMTDLMTDETQAGLQAMVNSLNDDSIQPTITPVFDDSSLGLSALNRSFEGLTPMMQATVDSFHDETPNYNSRFDMLANAINNTNALVNSFMSMVADGDIITVNVNAEADPNNIYNYVIDANRQRFRQTGKNPLAY